MKINPILEADSLFVCDTDHSHLRLINDSRWPWFIVLPRNSDATELHHLDQVQRNAFLEDINQLSDCLQQYTGCRSINIGMLGNVVSALHCHVVARDEGDPNWPKPIWGFGSPVTYGNEGARQMVDVMTQQFADRLSNG